MPLSGAGAGASTSAGIFNGIVRTAAAAGIIAGLLLTGVQHLQVIPIISQAEVYESSQEAQPVVVAHEHATQAGAEHGHDHENAHAHASEEAHSHGGWEPEDGLERTLYTVLADVSMAVGYALLLAALICLRGNGNGNAINWPSGLLWGAAGYAVFFIAPSLGLPPELPGTAAAPVAARQGWWLCTALSTAVALGMLVFGRKSGRRLWLTVGAVALLCVPHLVGAPQPLVHASAAPAELASSFIVATALANAVFWLALGGLTGYFSKRFG
ncbi:MAG: CbtA family protein [Duganella sp.]